MHRGILFWGRWLGRRVAARLLIASLCAGRLLRALPLRREPRQSAVVLRALCAAVALEGATHAVSGASTASLVYLGTNVLLSVSSGFIDNGLPQKIIPEATLYMTNGVPTGFRATIYVSEAAAAGYEITDLPPGLVGNTIGVASGTPTTTGNYTVSITGYKDPIYGMTDGLSNLVYDDLNSRYYVVEIHIAVFPAVDSGIPPPVILTQPKPQTVLAGGTTSFSVQASGTNLTYLWMQNGVQLYGDTNATLTLTGARPNFAGAFQAVVSNQGGSVTSAPVQLTVLPAFTSQTWPQGGPLPAHLGELLSLNAVAEGVLPMTYQWYHDGRALPGSTNTTLTVGPVTTNDAGVYLAVMQCPTGNATNLPIEVAPAPPLTATVMPGPGGTILSWNALPGRSYAADLAASLWPSDWKVWVRAGLTNGVPVSESNPAAAFFRVRAIDP